MLARSSLRFASAILLTACPVLYSPRSAVADPVHSTGQFVSGTGTLLYLGAGILSPLGADRPYGVNHAVRVVDCTLAAGLLAEGLGDVTNEKRPNSNAHDSFPSSHAAAAFAVAASQAELRPKQAWAWYAGAAAISSSRLILNEHHTQDVVAGAVIGYVLSRWEMSLPHGLILQPWIHEDKPGLMFVISR